MPLALPTQEQSDQLLREVLSNGQTPRAQLIESLPKSQAISRALRWSSPPPRTRAHGSARQFRGRVRSLLLRSSAVRLQREETLLDVLYDGVCRVEARQIELISQLCEGYLLGHGDGPAAIHVSPTCWTSRTSLGVNWGYDSDHDSRLTIEAFRTSDGIELSGGVSIPRGLRWHRGGATTGFTRSRATRRSSFGGRWKLNSWREMVSPGRTGDCSVSRDLLSLGIPPSALGLTRALHHVGSDTVGLEVVESGSELLDRVSEVIDVVMVGVDRIMRHSIHPNVLWTEELAIALTRFDASVAYIAVNRYPVSFGNWRYDEGWNV